MNRIAGVAFILLLVVLGCGSTLPADTMSKFAETLELSKAVYMTVCENPALQQCVVAPAEQCEVVRARLNDAVDVYTELNNELKADE